MNDGAEETRNEIRDSCVGRGEGSKKRVVKRRGGDGLVDLFLILLDFDLRRWGETLGFVFRCS